MAALTQAQFKKLFPQIGNEPVTGSLANVLNVIKQPLDKYALDQRIPVVGGMSTSDALGLTGTQGLVKDFSRGKDITGDMRMFDAMGMLPMAAPALNISTKAAKALGKEAARQIGAGTGIGKYVPDPNMYVLPPEKYRGAPLKGMPTNIDMGGGRIEQFGTDQRIVDTANKYMADRGLLYVPQSEYATVDPVRGKRIADAFEEMKDQPNNKKVKQAYDALIEETIAQYEAARKAGAKFEFMPAGQDLYGNPRNAINDIVTNQHMYVFPTESGFGSLTEAQAANPLLQKTGEKWNGMDVTANDIFRAVHDYYGHAKHGVGFRAGGEENAWQSHARMYSPEARPAATSETRGQNSWVNFGKYGKQNQLASPLDTIYADQKTGLMPDWTMIEGFIRR